MLFRKLSPADRGLIRDLRERGERSRNGRDGKNTEMRRVKIPHWSEKDIVHGNRTESLAVILRTSGCSWGRKSNCTMCGYFLDSRDSSSVLEDFRSIIEGGPKERFLKIYNSGSFLDPGEIPGKAQQEILHTAGEYFDRVLIESRPEYITRASLKPIRELADLEVAIGLESADNDVLMHSINKGFTFQDYERAVRLLNSMDIPVRTYLLLKPPFLTEGDAINDVVESIHAVEEYSETISINPMNIQNFTFAEHLFRKGVYHPPYLWSLLECLRTPASARLMSAPSGGGSSRGAHNCGTCDREILEKIATFSLDRDPSGLDHPCTCREEWKDLMALEGAVRVSLR